MNQPHLACPCSLNAVAIATIQGALNILKSMKLNPANLFWLNNILIANSSPLISANDLPLSVNFASMPRVAVACSFATSADTDATAPCQFPNPSGENIGAINSPNDFKILSSSSTNSSLKLKCMRNHKIMQAAKIIVPAFIINPLTLSHTCMNTPFIEGK